MEFFHFWRASIVDWRFWIAPFWNQGNIIAYEFRISTHCSMSIYDMADMWFSRPHMAKFVWVTTVGGPKISAWNNHWTAYMFNPKKGKAIHLKQQSLAKMSLHTPRANIIKMRLYSCQQFKINLMAVLVLCVFSFRSSLNFHLFPLYARNWLWAFRHDKLLIDF